MVMSVRREILAVTLIVLMGAVLVRALYIPPAAEQHVEAAEERFGLDLAEPNRWFSAWAIGDGQAFALIATDPSGRLLADAVDSEATYRFSRAGFGWLAWASSLGNEMWVAYGLGIASVLSLGLVLATTIRERLRLGSRAWLIILNPALYLGLGGDTAEPLAIALLTLAIGSGSVLAAALLGMTRPTYLVGLLGRWRLLSWGLVAAIGLTAYSLVQFGADRFVPSGGRVGLPLVAYFEHPSWAGFALLGLAVTTLVIGLKHRNWGWVGAALLVLCFGADVTRDPVNAWRAAGMLPVLWAFGVNYVPDSATAAKREDPVAV